MAGRTSVRGAAGRVICSGFVVFSPLIELRFLGSWLGHICWSWTLFLNRKAGTGLNSVLYVLALCLGKNDSVPGAYEIPPMIVSLFSLLILIRVCREILSHLIWGVFLWQLYPTADMIDFSESATKYWGFSVFGFFILEVPYMTVYLLLVLSIENESFVFETCFASNRSPYVKAVLARKCVLR